MGTFQSAPLATSYNMSSDLTLVFPRIYLSNVITAHDLPTLKQAGITHIINLSGTENAFPDKFKYLTILIDDHQSENIHQYFNKTNAFILSTLIGNGRVLVHCAAGVSRSPTIVIAYLIEHHNFTPQTALKHIRLMRPIVEPNFGFMNQLEDYFSNLNVM